MHDKFTCQNFDYQIAAVMVMNKDTHNQIIKIGIQIDNQIIKIGCQTDNQIIKIGCQTDNQIIKIGWKTY
jgi:hypothetical protein